MKIRILLTTLLFCIGISSNAQSLFGLGYALGSAAVSSAKKAYDKKKETKAQKEVERASYDYSDVYVNAKGKIKKKELKNGDYYVGEWSKGKPHGYGKMIYANKSIYTGNWNYGNIEGYGKIILHNGSQYSGDWHDNKYHGKGKFTSSNGDWYDGQWNLGEIEGAGKVYIRSKSANFEGDSKCEILNDILKFKPLSGTFTTSSKIMEGRWESDTSNSWSYGTFIGTCQTDSLIFTGSMNNDTFTNGELTFKNKKLGSHKGLFSNGRIYDGTSDGFIDYSYLCNNPANYIGAWKNGKFIGKVEGNQYSDNLESFKLDVDASGTIIGEFKLKDGGTYNGKVQSKKFDGNGELVLSNNKYSGIWKDGEWIEGTAIIKPNDSNHLKETYIMRRYKSQLIVEDPTGDLSGSYSLSTINYKNPLGEIKQQRDSIRHQEEKRLARTKAIKEIDSKYKGMVFYGEGSILALCDTEGQNALVGLILGSFMTQTLYVTFLPEGKVQLREKDSNVKASQPNRLSDVHLLAAAMNSTKGLTFDAQIQGNKIILEDNLYLEISNDKKTLKIFGPGAAYRLRRK